MCECPCDCSKYDKIINIDENKLLTCLNTTSLDYFDISENIARKINKDEYIYTIPKYGDILLDIIVNGDFIQAELYNGLPEHPIIYDRLLTSGVLNPFPKSGIPLIQMSTSAMYIKIKSENIESVNIKAKYVYLDYNSRKLLVSSTINNGKDGVRIEHKDKNLYQLLNISHMYERIEKV